MSILSRLFRAPARGCAAAAVVVVVAAIASEGVAVAAQPAESLYTRALAREREIRGVASRATLTKMRAVVQSYEALVRRYPRSGYCDNALWQGGNLALLAFDRFGQPADKRTGLRLLAHLRAGYPASSLAARAAEVIRENETRPSSHTLPEPPVLESKDARPAVDPAVPPEPSLAAAAPPPVEALSTPAQAVGTTHTSAQPIVIIKEVKRTPLPDGVRVSIEMDGESLYRSERLENPKRVFFDLKGTRAVGPLQDATLTFSDDIVREIRFGRHPQNLTRVVMDLESVEHYTVFTLYNPFRLVVDFHRSALASAARSPLAGAESPSVGTRSKPLDPPRTLTSATKPVEVPAAKESVPLIPRAAPAPVSPGAPTTNGNGQFSLSRQLGLGISRIVLDAGHGGHDPGARANGLNESELVLDVTLRLRNLLAAEPGIDVVLTRDRDVFIPLEERTAIANRNGADLFLSIHANASRNLKARGIETYFLNFASNRDAEAVAARENSASGRTMRSLPDIVRAIALNNKIDESRDFADIVQSSMVRGLGARNSLVKDLGVKQAPFVVLIGAGMPSVLAEISFVTSKSDSALLKTGAYRQRIAESLMEAVLRYQRSLKGTRVIAAGR